VQAKDKIILCWSGGKDSALTYHALRGRYEIVSLLTTVSGEADRISHHEVCVELLEQQARAIGTRLHKIVLPGRRCSNAVYEAAMKQALIEYKNAGIHTVAFGDIFLQDLREYRERNLARMDMQAIFPLWRRDTPELIRSFIDLGFKARLACVDGDKLGAAFAGRLIDAGLIEDLPEGVDPCGENGEFHSYVYDGPIFQEPVGVTVGETVSRGGRYYADLQPAEPAPAPAGRG